MRARLLIAAALAVLALSAPLARASYDPLSSGATRITLDTSFLRLLKENGVALSTTAPAKLAGGTVTFPVAGGRFDPIAQTGVVEHEGALVFSAGKRSIPLRALQLKTTQKRMPFSAKVGGSQLKLAAARTLTVARAGFAEKVAVAKLSLSAKLATRLGKKLRLPVEEGIPLGSSRTSALPETTAILRKNKAAFDLDPAFAAKLASLFVAVNPIFPAEHPGPEFTLPISGGAIAPGGDRGTLETAGSLEFLQLGGGQVFWSEVRLELGDRLASAGLDVQPSPPYAGATESARIASLTPTTQAVVDNLRRTVSVSGLSLTADPSTAAIFNEVFAKPQGKDGVFAAGEALGTVSFSAQGQ